MIERCGLPLKSLDTSSSSVYSTYSLRPFSAAPRRIALSSSRVVSFLVCATRYTNETVGLGTRSENPSNVPSISGIVRYSAFAAPVDVGMMFVAALRARRRSLCGASRVFWSLVYEWIVDMKPLTQPSESTIGFTAVAKQFVVHDAFEMMLWLSGSYLSSLTPSTSVMSSPLAGAGGVTFL